MISETNWVFLWAIGFALLFVIVKLFIHNPTAAYFIGGGYWVIFYFATKFNEDNLYSHSFG